MSKLGPKKGYKQTEEHKQKISKANKGKKGYWKGKNLLEETKQKMSIAHKGKIISEKTRRKLSEFNKGKKLSEETKKKLSEKRLKRKKKIGYLNSKETRKKLSEAQKGKKNSMYGKKQTKKFMEWRKTFVLPKYDTLIEVKIQNFLKQLGIEFFTHQYMKIEHGYQCDILIPSKRLVIECDGNYWHKYPIGKDIDHIRTKELIEKGFKVLRLWENEIKVMKLNEFMEKLK